MSILHLHNYHILIAWDTATCVTIRFTWALIATGAFWLQFHYCYGSLRIKVARDSCTSIMVVYTWVLTHLPQDKMATNLADGILKYIFLKKMIELRLIFHWCCSSMTHMCVNRPQGVKTVIKSLYPCEIFDQLKKKWHVLESPGHQLLWYWHRHIPVSPTQVLIKSVSLSDVIWRQIWVAIA